MKNQKSQGIDLDEKNESPLQEAKPDPLQILNDNDQILYHLKSQLKSQIQSYEYAFSPKVTRKYTEDRDFDTFKESAEVFKQKSIKFIDSLVQVRDNSMQVIKNLPQKQSILPSSGVDGFDVFLAEQTDHLIEQKIKDVRIQNDRLPFSKN